MKSLIVLPTPSLHIEMVRYCTSYTNNSMHVCTCARVRVCVRACMHVCMYGPPLWARRQHARLSRSGPGFDPQSGQVSWVRFFRGFSSPVRQMSGSFRSPRSPNIIWTSLSLSLSIIIHYWRQ